MNKQFKQLFKWEELLINLRHTHKIAQALSWVIPYLVIHPSQISIYF